MQIDVNGVKITLTKEQLQEIDGQLKANSVPKQSSDINSFEDALNVLRCGMSENTQSIPVSAFEKLKIIIKAANFLDNNNQEWKADFKDNSYYKYLPYIYLEKSGGRWVVGDDGVWYGLSAPAGLHFKKRETAKTIAEKFLPLYLEYYELN